MNDQKVRSPSGKASSLCYWLCLMASTANALAHEANDYSYLNVMQAVLWVIFFLPFYLLGGLQLLMSPGTVPQSWEPILVPIFLWILFVAFFFTKAIVYVLISLIVVIRNGN